MDHSNKIQPKLSPSTTKLFRSIQNLIHHQSSPKYNNKTPKNYEVLEAFLAKIFARITSMKAAYAELQLAHTPYSTQEIHSSDESVVRELRSLSELKHSYLRGQIDPSPLHVTLMLAEIQEQQSLMRTYEISLKSLELERKSKDSEMVKLRSRLQRIESRNRCMVKELRSENIRFDTLKPSYFIEVLSGTIACVRNFVKQLVRDMVSANWDVIAAAESIHPGISYAKNTQRCFAFESYVTREIFDGFNSSNFTPNSRFPQDPLETAHYFFERFKKLRWVSPARYVAMNSGSSFAGFVREKYLKMVNPKMECSLFGSLKQRNLVASGDYTKTDFFAAFAEMAKWVWLLHCVARSFEEGTIGIFQVKKDSPFSEVFMESVNKEEEDCSGGGGGNCRVGFTVVPGFKVGKTVARCQVFMSSNSM